MRILWAVLLVVFATGARAQINEIPPPMAEPSALTPDWSTFFLSPDDRDRSEPDPFMPQTGKEPCLHDLDDMPPPNACVYR